MALDPKIIAKLKRDLKELNAIYKKIGEDPIEIEFDTATVDDIKLLRDYLSEARVFVDDLEDGFGGINESIKNIVREWKSGFADPTKEATRSFTKLQGLAQKFSDDAKGIAVMKGKEVKANEKLIRVERDRLKILQTELSLKAKRLGGIEELSEAEQTVLANLKSEYKVQEELLGLAKARVKEEKKIQKAMGISGAAVQGITGALGKLGIKGEFFEDMEEDMRESAKSGSKLKVAMSAIGGLAKGIGEALTDPVVVLGLLIKAFKELMKIFNHVLKLTNEIGQGFGVAGENAKELKAQIHGAGDASGDMFYFTEEIFAAQMSLNKAVGQNLKFNEENAKTFQDLTLYMGMSEEAAAGLYKLSAQLGVPFSDIRDVVNDTTNDLNSQGEFSLLTADAVERIGNASSSVRFNIKGGTEGLVKAAHTAARLGTTMNEIAAAAESHLDFESSIGKEIEAEMFLQRDLNLEKLRMAALTGDTATAAAEQERLIRENMGSLEGNVLAQQAFAEALGISQESLADQMMTLKQNKNLTGEQLKMKQAEQEAMVKAGQDAATFDRAMESAVKQLKAALEPIATTIGPAILNIVQTVVPMITPVLKFLGTNMGKVLLGVAGAFYAVKGAKSLFGKMFGGIMERGATPANPQFVYNVNEQGGGGGAMDLLGRTLGKRGIFGGKMFKGLSKVFGGKNTFVGKQLRNLAAMSFKRSSFMNQVVANNKTLSKLIPSMSKLTSKVSTTSKVATGVSTGTKVASGLAKTMKVLGPIGAAADMIIGGYTGSQQANMSAQEQKAAGVEVGISKTKATTLGVLTGGAEKGSMFSGALGIEKGSAADETAGIAGAGLRGAGIGAAIGTMILPGIGTAIGAGIGGLVGSVSEGFKVFSDPDSKLRQGFDSFVSSTSEKLSEWGTSAKESISNFASKSMDSVKTLASGAKEVASNAYNYVKDSSFGKTVSSVGSKISSAASTAASYLNPFNYFANGGIVTKPTMGIIGEGGQSEAVIPLNRAGEFGLGGNQEVVALLKTLISEVRKGGNVYLDGNKVGYALALQSSQMG